MPLLRLEHVSAGYGDSRPILNDVSFCLEQGEQVVIIGGNGEGKTTLLKVAAGLLKPKHGRSEYSGKTSPGFIHQVPFNQLICDTVQEEIQFTLRINGVNESLLEQRTAELLDKFQLTEMASRGPRTLSGGQQQRLALAATLCRSPELLLLDEPDAFLDGAARSDFRSFFAAHVTSAAIWTVCRESEIPKNLRVYRLSRGMLS